MKASEPGEYRDESRQKLIDGLSVLVNAMNTAGPYFAGDSLGAVDIALISFAYRIGVLLGAYRDFELPREGEVWRRYRSWYDAMLEHSVYRATAFDQGAYEQRLIDHCYPYSPGEGQYDVTKVN